MAEYLARIGERIRVRREELGLSQGDIARRLPGKSDGNQVSRWERGRHKPSDDTLEALAEILQVDVAYFIAAEPDKTRTPDPFNGSMGRRDEDRVAHLQNQIDSQSEKLDRLLDIRDTTLERINERLTGIEECQDWLTDAVGALHALLLASAPDGAIEAEVARIEWPEVPASVRRRRETGT